MKRTILAALALLWMFPAASPAQSRGINYPSRHRNAYYVIASGAPGWMRALPGAKLCDGTHDEVQIQAAESAADDNGGIVHLVGGGFYLGVPEGTVVYTGTTDVSDQGTTSRLEVSAFDGTFDIDDVSVGDIVRCYVDGGADPADNNDDVMFTVTATDTDNDYIDLHGEMSQEYSGADDLKFTRVPYAITLSSKVTLRGDGQAATRLWLADDEDVSGVLVAGSFCRVENLDVRAETNPSTYNRLRNGLAVADGSAEIDIRNVCTWYLGGDGKCYMGGHSVRVHGDSWEEACKGRGGVAVGCGELLLDGLMIEQNAGTGLLIKGCTRVSVVNCFGGIQAAGADWLYCQDSDYLSIQGNRPHLQTDADGDAIVLEACNSVTVNGNPLVLETASTGIVVQGDCYYSTFTANPLRLAHASAIGFDLTSSSYNVVTGNVVRQATAGSTFLTATTGWGRNDIFGNIGANRAEETRIGQATNRSGGTLSAYRMVQRVANGEAGTFAGDQDQIEHATAAGCAAGRVLGLLPVGNLADDGRAAVQLQGRFPYGQIDSDDAQGQAVAIGDPLTISDTTAGCLVEAAAGEVVVAYAMAVNAGDNNIVSKAIFVLPAGERWTVPAE